MTGVSVNPGETDGNYLDSIRRVKESRDCVVYCSRQTFRKIERAVSMPSIDREQITKTTVMGLDVVQVAGLSHGILFVCNYGDVWPVASQMPEKVDPTI